MPHMDKYKEHYKWLDLQHQPKAMITYSFKLRIY
jgi:hypothetical protein